ncbi:hypothetical protein AHAS_Ahas03G0146000 [Arachis hypogaea]
MGSGPRNTNNDPYSKTYNQGWRNHPNFRWRDQPQRPQNFNNNSQGGVQQNNDLEAILTGFRQKTRASIKNLEIQMGQIATRVNEIDQRTTNSLPSNTIPNPREECKAITVISGQVASTEAQVMQETRASIRNLEVLVGQLSKQILDRSASTFQGDIVVNPGEDCKVIQLRSGKVAGSETKVNEELVEKEAPEEKKEEVKHAPPKRADNPFLDSLDTYPTLPKAPEYKPKMSYPQRFQKETKDKQFSKFLEIFRKLQINIIFAEVLEKNAYLCQVHEGAVVKEKAFKKR